MRLTSQHPPPRRSVALLWVGPLVLTTVVNCDRARTMPPSGEPRPSIQRPAELTVAAGPKANSSPNASSRATSNHYVDSDFEFEAASSSLCPTEAPFLPEADHERLSVLVRIASRSARPIPVQALAFRIEGKQGEYSPTLAGCRDALSVSTLSEGQRAHGEVAFDVPLHDGPFELVYEPFLLGRTPIIVRVLVPPIGGN